MKNKKIILLIIVLLFILLFTFSCSKGEIIINPYEHTPLSAIYKLEKINNFPVTVLVKGLYGENDISYTYPSRYGIEFDIHGLFPESTNTIIVKYGLFGLMKIKKEVYIPEIYMGTNYIETKYPVEIYNLPKEKNINNPDMYFVSKTIEPWNWFVLGISRNGYLRYFNSISYISKSKVDNKRTTLYVVDKNSGVYSLIGKQLVNFPTRAHHDSIKKGSNYIYLSFSDEGREDGLVEVDSEGNIIRELNFGKLISDIVLKNNDPAEINILNKIVFSSSNPGINTDGVEIPVNWFHANSLVYDKDTDILYVSSRKRGVFAINYSSWTLKWWMADRYLNTMVGNRNTDIPYDLHIRDLKSLEPYRVNGDAWVDGPKNQHALFLLNNGNIGMFDNQGDESNNTNGSRYVEYRVFEDFNNFDSEKIYEYKYSNVFSGWTSDVDYSGEKYENILLTYGNSGEQLILEVEKDSKEVLFKLETRSNIRGGSLYRADKMPFYYEDNRVYAEDDNLKN